MARITRGITAHFSLWTIERRSNDKRIFESLRVLERILFIWLRRILCFCDGSTAFGSRGVSSPDCDCRDCEIAFVVFSGRD
jgi:hypothetical protein